MQVAQRTPSRRDESYPRVTVPACWRVSAAESSVTFSARGFWGLARTTGSFTRVSGAAQVEASGLFSGELVIATRTLTTGMRIRDRHLRGRDFFDVERYPEIRFSADRLIASGDRHVVRGELSVRDRIVELELPIELAEEPGRRLRLTAHAVIERESLGLGHSPLGMIRGPAEVRVDLVLMPAESPNSADDRSPNSHPDSAPVA